MHKEIDIQIACNSLLDDLSFQYKFRHFHCPNEGKRSPQYQIKLRKMGLKKGCPDFIIEYPEGRLIYVELKTPKGKLSESQKLWKVKSTIFKTPHFVIQGNLKECLEHLAKVIVQYAPSRNCK
jgi:predicted RNA-binding Zn-ribbon protein involved in translation (DUF1610 family)|tara:strand:- start:65 stop:433 length:369 start_codon:yes stop_codon:yes gene_type:complete